MMRFAIAILFLLIGCQSIKAQDFSNKGRDFWLCYPGHVDAAASAMGIYITSDVAATGTIFVGSTQIPFTLTANQVVRKFLGPNAGGDAPNTAVELSGQQDGISINAGIRVVSSANVVVFAHIIRSARSGATLVLPNKVLGKNYILPNHRSTGGATGNQGYGELCVMAVDTNTVVEIIPSINSRNGLRPAGVPFTITLANPGDVYQLQFVRQGDASGTRINSVNVGGSGCKPIAVFTATTWTGLDCSGASGGDNLFQQIFPISSWGKEFLTSPLKKVYTNPSDNNVDHIKVYVDDPTTVVTKLESGITTTLTGYNATGKYYEFTTSNPTFIQANKAIQVVQLVSSQQCPPVSLRTQSDPELVVLNSIEQTIKDITVFSAHQNFVPPGQSSVTTHYINVITKASNINSFRINGNVPTSNWNAIPGTGYAYLKENVSGTAGTNPVFNLKADSGFSAIAYGFGDFESYGYNAGTNVKDLTQNATAFNPNFLGDTTITIPLYCKNSDFNLFQRLPYKPTSIEWNFTGSGLPNPPFSNFITSNPISLIFDSTFVNGKWVYRYRNPNTYNVPNAGVYPFKVFVNNPTADGCSGIQELEYELTIVDPPQVDFTWTHTGCVKDTVFFRENTNLGPNDRPIYKWRWSFHDNTTDSVKAPVKKYTTGGSFPVKLQVISDAGCLSDTLTKTIIISDTATCTLQVTSGAACAGAPLTVTPTCTISGTGVGTISQWIWIWGDGSPNDTLAAGTPATHTYTTTGTFTIIVKTITSSGCASINSLTITVNGSSSVDFNLPANVCLPYGLATFINTSNGGTPTGTYTWNFGDASTPQTAINGTHNYTSTGPFNVTLSNINTVGCSNTITKPFNNIRPRPTANYTNDAKVCIKDSLQFTSTSLGNGGTITNYFWDFGDGSTGTGATIKKRWATSGPKTVTHWILTDQGCMSDTMTKTIMVNASPTNDFTFNNIGRCARLPITFTSTTTSANGAVDQWNWNWGDGPSIETFNNGAPVQHTYNTEGTFTVKLWVRSDEGCFADTVIKTITITATPVASFVLPNGICLPSGLAQFTNNTTISDGTLPAVTYVWDFGDATPTVASPPAPLNITHNYTGTGPYNIKLTATSAVGCVDDSIQTLSNIFAQPQANFTNSSEVCLNDNITFTSTSNPINGTIIEHYWDNGSGSFALGTATLITSFSTIGPKTIRHYIKTSNGCISDTMTKSITVNPLPTANFTHSALNCVNGPITFTSNSIANSGVVNQWIWNWGDGSAIDTVNTNAPIIHTFTTSGNFIVTLTVKTDKGCMSIPFTQSITIHPKPVANFNLPANVCLPIGAALFTNTTTLNNGTMVNGTYQWNFGDGSPIENTLDGSHNYASVGPFNVNLQATSAAGCVHDTTKIFNNIRPRPTANFTSNAEVCVNINITFTSSSNGNGGTITEYYWDNGNGTFVLGTNTLTASYTTNGTKTIRHYVKTDQGCLSDTITKTIYVNSLPVANFTISSPRCEDKNITFTSTSTTADGVIGNFVWNFGDGSAPVPVSSNLPRNHVYDTTGNYTVTLAVTTDKGCTNVAATQTVTVYHNPVVHFGMPEICLNDPIAQFTDSTTIADGTQNSFTYLWNFGDPNATVSNPNTSTLKNPTHQYIQATNYSMWLQVTSNNGCVTRKDSTFTVNGATPSANFTVLNASNLCSNQEVVIQNNSTVNFGNVTYLEIYWDWGNNPTLKTIDNDPLPNKQYNFNYPPFGTPATKNYVIRMVAYSGAITGPCVNATTRTITVLASPNIVFNTVPEICLENPAAIITQAQETTGIPGVGVFTGPGIVGNQFNPSVAGVGTHTIRYTYTTPNGCNTFKEQTVTVNPTPNVNAGPDITILDGGNGLLQASTTSTNLTYLWTPATWLTNTTILQPTSNALDDITYTIKVTSNKGCVATDQVFVKVLKGPRVPNAFSPNGDGINDKWEIEYLDTYPGCIVEVFNIYGQKVYRSVGYGTPWDGRFNGKTLPLGTYYYIIEPKNGRKPITGYVGIVK